MTREVLINMAPRPEIACCLYATAPMVDIHDMALGYRLVSTERQFAMSVGAEPLRDAGQFYFGRVEAFTNGYPLIHPHTAMIPIDERRVCDINTPEDWSRAEKMYEALHV